MQSKTTGSGSSLSDRLEWLIQERFGGRWTHFARAAGISLGTFQRYVNGSGKPSFQHVIRICETGGVSCDWLLMGKDPPAAWPAAATGGAKPGEGVHEEAVLYLPRLDAESVPPAAGQPPAAAPGRPGHPFGRAELQRLGSDPENLVVVQVRGESMAPTFNPGDDLIVDLTRQQTLVDGIYAVRIDDTLMIKRLQHLPGERIRVGSDNPAYEPFEVNLAETERFWVVGRVVWAGRRF